MLIFKLDIGCILYQNSLFLFITRMCVTETCIMNILYSTHELRVIGLQFKVDFTTFASSTLPIDICKRKRG